MDKKKPRKRTVSKIKGQKFENKVRMTIQSGSLLTDPADISYVDKNNTRYCVESKFTDKKGFRITDKMVQKLWNQALDMQKIPKLVIGLPHPEIDGKMFMITCNISMESKER